MTNDDCALRAVVRNVDGAFEAQLVDIDLAVRAESEAGLLSAIAHAIIVTYEVARDLGETPFMRVYTPSSPTGALWCYDRAREAGMIELPPEVADSLAAVLHHHRPIRKVAVLKPAA